MFFDKTAEDRLAPVWVLLATTGLRRAEVLGLRWSEVDLDRGRLRISQTVTEVRGRLIIQGDGKTDAAERSIGLDTRAGHRAALIHLAAQLPAAVLADLLHLTPGTAVRWVNNAGGDWSRYAAALAAEAIPNLTE